MSVDKKTTHVEEARADLVEQFKGKPKLEAWQASYVKEVQELEDTLDDIRQTSNIDTVTDAQMDVLGAIVGEERQGRNDVQYRTAIKAKIKLNLSQGTQEDIRGLIRAVAGDVTVRFFEFFPAAFVAQVLDPIDPALIDPARIGLFVNSGRGAAIRSQTVIGVLGSFQFDGPAGTGFDEGKYAGVF